MLGAIIGDVVGSRWEFHVTNNYNFECFSNANGFTDDTICTIAIADALMNNRDYADSLRDWCHRYPNPMGGYGSRFRKWLMSNTYLPYQSFGNGSAMRVSPATWIFSCVYDVLHEAEAVAKCTHNHREGIKGAQAVAWAIYACRSLHKRSGNIISQEIEKVLRPIAEYCHYDIDIHKEDVLNKFDETCQGTIPVAFWIICQSFSFEDAIRKAVSLGADADTLGAIVGSIAEAIWGIPEWMKKEVMSFLPFEMKMVIQDFYRCLDRLPRLLPRCHYYQGERISPYADKDLCMAWRIEHEWAVDLAKHYSNADKIVQQMEKYCGLKQWQEWADFYQIPVSLVGYIFRYTADEGMFMHECIGSFLSFLNRYYK